MRFKDKTVLVTAGTRGIGKAVVEAFLDEGAYVATCSRDAKTLSVKNDKLFKLSGDIKDLEFLKHFHKSVINHFGSSVDILVNNNGGPDQAPQSPIRKAHGKMQLTVSCSTIRTTIL